MDVMGGLSRENSEVGAGGRGSSGGCVDVDAPALVWGNVSVVLVVCACCWSMW